MLCRVEMPTNEQIFGRFYRYQMLHGGRGGRGSVIMLPVLLLALAGMVAFMPVSAWFVVAIIAIVVAYLAYSLYFRPTQIFRKKGGAALQTETYIFTPTGYTRSVRHEEAGMLDNTSGQYSGLLRAVETGKDFYLYTSPTQAYMVDKEYFTKGTPEELRETLRTAMGDKFKGKK